MPAKKIAQFVQVKLIAKLVSKKTIYLKPSVTFKVALNFFTFPISPQINVITRLRKCVRLLNTLILILIIAWIANIIAQIAQAQTIAKHVQAKHTYTMIIAMKPALSCSILEIIVHGFAQTTLQICVPQLNIGINS